MKCFIDYMSYVDVQSNFVVEKLWEFFDGNCSVFNIVYECVDCYVG